MKDRVGAITVGKGKLCPWAAFTIPGCVEGQVAQGSEFPPLVEGVTVRGLELDDLKGPFQSKPICGSIPKTPTSIQVCMGFILRMLL